jgi:hypothetical protein
MPRPGISDKVTDLTNRVSVNSTYASAIVVASKKGPINKPVLVNGQSDFLRKFTPNEKLELGWDTAMFEAWQYLATQQNLYVVRAANNALYGGCKIRTFKSELEHAPLENGFAVAGQADFDYVNDALVIYGADQGLYNNDLAVAIITDPEEVKQDGCFIVRVYKNGVAVENHICSLDPSLKNGFGVNCFAENVLKTSLYVRADVNDDADAIQDICYTVDVKGVVTFDNEYIKCTNVARRNHEYAEKDVVKVAQLSGQTAFYVCTKAGRSADIDNAPEFALNNEYKKQVEDGEAIFALAEIVKEYLPDTGYNAGDIVTITKGANVMNFRALIDGTTNLVEPMWLENDTPLIRVEDGTITWVNLKQVEQVSSVAAYTYKEGAKDSKLDLTKYKTYSDYFLNQETKLPAAAQVTDPTVVVPVVIERPVVYTAIYTGDQSKAHYTLPKASEKVNGAYVPTPLAGGHDGDAVLDGARITALNTLKSTKDYTFQIVMDGGNTTPAYQRAIEDLCVERKDSCHGIISVPFECGQGMLSGDAQVDTLDYRKNTLNANSYNLELYTTHQLIYDEFNDRNMYVSPGCFVASRIMDVAQTYGWHYTAAGQNRGVINSLDNAASYSDGVIDTFCDNQINPIIKEPGFGQIIGDDYTLLSTACDLQDAHISRYLNIYLRPAIRDALKPFLFEFNDDETRTLITKMLETFMQPEVASRAIQAYKIVCDTTNNTGSDIQNSICNVWVYVQPTKIIRWIKVNYIVSPQSVEIGSIAY